MMIEITTHQDRRRLYIETKTGQRFVQLESGRVVPFYERSLLDFLEAAEKRGWNFTVSWVIKRLKELV